jgi:hypothetical protein
LLAGVFCQAWKNEEASKQDLGITYMMQPETKVAPEYWRGPSKKVGLDLNNDTAWIGGSLYDTYMAIQNDLEQGLKLVSDEYYSVPRYHFNVKAAHAFAARFYLYKREWAKVVEHADYVLTTTDESTLAMLFDATTNRDQSNIELAFKHYIDVKEPCNLCSIRPCHLPLMRTSLLMAAINTMVMHKISLPMVLVLVGMANSQALVLGLQIKSWVALWQKIITTSSTLTRSQVMAISVW